MLEKFKSKRVIFKTGQQKRFIEESRKILGLSNQELSRLLHISNRTLSDWKKEKFNMSLGAVTTISRKTGRKIPEGIKIMGPFGMLKKEAELAALLFIKNMELLAVIPRKENKNGLSGGREMESLEITLSSKENQLEFQKNQRNWRNSLALFWVMVE